jgi:BON domain
VIYDRRRSIPVKTRLVSDVMTNERGVVALDGKVRLASDVLHAVERTRRAAGVVDVVDQLSWTADDREPQVGPLF